MVATAATASTQPTRPRRWSCRAPAATVPVRTLIARPPRRPERRRRRRRRSGRRGGRAMSVRTGTIAAGALHDQRRGLVGWVLAVAAVATMYTAFYPSIGAAKFEVMLDAMPEFAKVMGFDKILSASGYVGATVYSLLGADRGVEGRVHGGNGGDGQHPADQAAALVVQGAGGDGPGPDAHRTTSSSAGATAPAAASSGGGAASGATASSGTTSR